MSKTKISAKVFEKLHDLLTLQLRGKEILLPWFWKWERKVEDRSQPELVLLPAWVSPSLLHHKPPHAFLYLYSPAVPCHDSVFPNSSNDLWYSWIHSRNCAQSCRATLNFRNFCLGEPKVLVNRGDQQSLCSLDLCQWVACRYLVHSCRDKSIVQQAVWLSRLMREDEHKEICFLSFAASFYIQIPNWSVKNTKRQNVLWCCSHEFRNSAIQLFSASVLLPKKLKVSWRVHAAHSP